MLYQLCDFLICVEGWNDRKMLPFSPIHVLYDIADLLVAFSIFYTLSFDSFVYVDTA